MVRNVRTLMLMALVVVAPMGLTGCGLLDALLAANPGGTGGGPVANHPQGTAQKVGGLLGGLGNGAAPRGPTSGGFVPRGEGPRPQGPVDDGFSPAPERRPGGGTFTPPDDGPATTAAEGSTGLREQPAPPVRPDPDSVARDTPGLRSGPGRIDDGGGTQLT